MRFLQENVPHSVHASVADAFEEFHTFFQSYGMRWLRVLLTHCLHLQCVWAGHSGSVALNPSDPQLGSPERNSKIAPATVVVAHVGLGSALNISLQCWQLPGFLFFSMMLMLHVAVWISPSTLFVINAVLTMIWVTNLAIF